MHNNGNDTNLINLLGIGLVGISHEFHIVFWNTWMEQHSGKKAKEVYNKNIFDVFPDLKSSRLPSALSDTIKFGYPAVISNVFNRTPFNLYRPHSRQELIQQAITVTPYSNGGNCKCVIQITDVTASTKREHALEQNIRERKLSAEELSKKNTILKAQLDASNDGILTVDQNGSVMDFNRKFAEIWGFNPATIDSFQFSALIEHILLKIVDKSKFQSSLDYSESHPEKFSSNEYRIINGQTIEIFCAPILGTDNIHYGRIWSFRDLSIYKDQEEQIRR